MANRATRARSTAKLDRATTTARYWTKRVEQVDSLAAVLTYGAPRALNRAYDTWERDSLLKNLPASLAGKRALDLGCGTGRITLALAKAGARVTGVDISSGMLAVCRSRARRAGLAEQVNLIENPVTGLDPSIGKFDLVTCFGLLEHLRPAERRHCLEVALAALKKRAKLLLVVNNSECVYRTSQESKGGKSQPKIPGHYVTTVGLNWLERFCLKQGAKMTVRAANPFYAWLHYGLVSSLGSKIPEAELRRLARKVTQLDLAYPLEGPIPTRLASHFMVELCLR